MHEAVSNFLAPELFYVLVTLASLQDVTDVLGLYHLEGTMLLSLLCCQKAMMWKWKNSGFQRECCCKDLSYESSIGLDRTRRQLPILLV